MTTHIITQNQYEQREARMLAKQLADIDGAPLADRREGYKCYLDTLLNTPEIIAERTRWILDGAYGFGVYQLSREMLADARQRPRRMKSFIVTMCRLVAALDHGCSARDCVKAWKQLTPAQQVHLDNLLTEELNSVELE